MPNSMTGPEGPELEGYQLEIKSKAARTKSKKIIRRTCPSGHGSDGSGPKWHALILANHRACKSRLVVVYVCWKQGEGRKGTKLTGIAQRARLMQEWSRYTVLFALLACLPSLRLLVPVRGTPFPSPSPTPFPSRVPTVSPTVGNTSALKLQKHR